MSHASNIDGEKIEPAEADDLNPSELIEAVFVESVEKSSVTRSVDQALAPVLVRELRRVLRIIVRHCLSEGEDLDDVLTPQKTKNLMAYLQRTAVQETELRIALGTNATAQKIRDTVFSSQDKEVSMIQDRLREIVRETNRTLALWLAQQYLEGHAQQEAMTSDAYAQQMGAQSAAELIDGMVELYIARTQEKGTDGTHIAVRDMKHFMKGGFTDIADWKRMLEERRERGGAHSPSGVSELQPGKSEQSELQKRYVVHELCYDPDDPESQRVLSAVATIYRGNEATSEAFLAMNRGDAEGAKNAGAKGAMYYRWEATKAEKEVIESITGVAYISPKQQLLQDLTGISGNPGIFKLFYLSDENSGEIVGYITIRVPPLQENEQETYVQFLQNKLLGKKSSLGTYQLQLDGIMSYSPEWRVEDMAAHQLRHWGEILDLNKLQGAGAREPAYHLLNGCIQALQQQGALPKGLFSSFFGGGYPHGHPVDADQQPPVVGKNPVANDLYFHRLDCRRFATRHDPRDCVVAETPQGIVAIQPVWEFIYKSSADTGQKTASLLQRRASVKR